MDLQMIQREIEKREKSDTCYDNCERLAWLYIVRDHMTTPSSSSPSTRLDKETAEAWVGHMKNEDPTHPTGGRWTMAQTTAVMKDKGLNYPEPEWYAVMNMLYSDYGPLLAKHGPKELDAYVELAKAWLDDKDAMPGKTARYYHSVVRGM